MSYFLSLCCNIYMSSFAKDHFTRYLFPQIEQEIKCLLWKIVVSFTQKIFIGFLSGGGEDKGEVSIVLLDGGFHWGVINLKRSGGVSPPKVWRERTPGGGTRRRRKPWAEYVLYKAEEGNIAGAKQREQRAKRRWHQQEEARLFTDID